MIKVVAKSGYLEKDMNDVSKLIDELIACTKKEHGCISYEFCQSVENPNIYAFIETWETMEDLIAHTKSEHYARIGPQLKEFKNEEFKLEIYNTLK